MATSNKRTEKMESNTNPQDVMSGLNLENISLEDLERAVEERKTKELQNLQTKAADLEAQLAKVREELQKRFPRAAIVNVPSPRPGRPRTVRSFDAPTRTPQNKKILDWVMDVFAADPREKSTPQIIQQMREMGYQTDKNDPYQSVYAVLRGNKHLFEGQGGLFRPVQHQS